MAGKIDKKYHDLCLFRDEAQGEPEFVNKTQSQVNDVYNLIYDFFSRYFDKGDFLSKKRYGAKNHYMIPYNGEEVLLHWANHDQYYIKTDEFFKNYSFKVGELQVSFKIKEAETESNNNKGEKKYFIPANGHAIEVQKGNVLTIWFQYRSLSEEEKKKYITRNIQDEFIQEVIKKIDAKNNGWKATLLKSNGDDLSHLEKHLRRYVNKNTCDFFIHKNLRGFLNHELEFFIKNEVLDLDEMELMDEQQLRRNMAKAKAIRGICQKIIEFLAQIEEFQKRLFEKKKFVMRTDYCMTLNKVPKEFYAEIGRNEQQVGEWTQLFKLEFGKVNRKTLDADFLKSHRFLVLDTKFFPQDFKDRLLGHFENLDQEIGGLIIKSENFQALALLKEKYLERVKCIYIDPPYNTGHDEFIYKDNYQHSSWLSMMTDRLMLARKFMQEDGVIFVTMDDNEVHDLKYLMDSIWMPNNFEFFIEWEARKSVSSDALLSYSQNHILFYAKNKMAVDVHKAKWRLPMNIGRHEEFSNPDNDHRGPWKLEPFDAPEIRPNLTYPITNPNTGKTYIPVEGRHWRTTEDEYKRFLREGRIIFGKTGNSKPAFKRYLSEIEAKGQVVTTWWDDIETTTDGTKILQNIIGYKAFNNPKPVGLVVRMCQLSTEVNDYVLDFFAGSGTTAHAVLTLNAEDGGNRKYILVEMGDYFDALLKPRIQKLMYSKEWKDGKPVSIEGISHMFKYQYLEQYEDTLNNIIFSDLSKTAQETLDGFNDYFLKYMLDFETRESPARLSVKQFENPFDYKLKITSGGEERIETVDLFETFNYLLGLEVERIRVFENNKRKYRVVFGRKENDKIVVIWRNIEGIDYEKERDFVEKTILKNEKFNSIYINGEDSLIPGAEPIEPEFKRLMEA